MNIYEVFMEEIKQRATNPSDISDHLLTIYFEALSLKPQLIVELGVRFGESTFVLERVARTVGSKLISVDLDDCSGVSQYPGWFFIQKDDLQFAAEFPGWCGERGINPQIDLLFIDTSHYFENTVAEIAAWFPQLAEHSKVILHDTNLKETFYWRNGQCGAGWNNERGVIRALEDYFGRSFDESSDFRERVNGWDIKHFSICNGLTVLEKGSFRLERLLKR
jgi:cephalosporin hydroxylase